MPTDRALRIDFHIHSNHSTDGDMPPADIIKYAKKSGLDAIAVTDHNSIRGGVEAQKIAGDLLVFVGSEIKTADGEIIGLNLKKDVPANLPLTETCRLVKKQGGFIIVPHPFDKFRSGIGKEMLQIMEFIDAVEIFNARTLAGRFNNQASEFAKKNNLPCVAGSDAHFKSEIGSVSMLVECGKEKGEILDAIKGGKIKIIGKKTGIKPHWNTFVRKMGRKF